MAALVFKLFSLSVKTIAKPVSTRFTNYVLEHPTFKTHVISLAQKFHSMEVGVSRAAEGKGGGKAFVGAMTDAKAVELASKMVSEGFVFTVGAGLLLWEYERGQDKEMKKKAAEIKHRDEMRQAAAEERHALAEENQKMHMIMDSMLQRLIDLEGQIQAMESQRKKRFWIV